MTLCSISRISSCAFAQQEWGSSSFSNSLCSYHDHGRTGAITIASDQKSPSHTKRQNAKDHRLLHSIYSKT